MRFGYHEAYFFDYFRETLLMSTHILYFPGEIIKVLIKYGQKSVFEHLKRYGTFHIGVLTQCSPKTSLHLLLLVR